MATFDLHMHSRYSFDGIMSPARMIELGKKRGLSGIAVSDHNTIAGGLEAASLNQDPTFLVIVGTEIATEVGDILALFVTQDIQSRQSMEVVAEIHDQGGVAILPHPHAHHQNLTPELFQTLDGVEIYNGRDKQDYSAKTYAEIAEPYGLATMADSDAHLYWEIGRACTEMEIAELSADAVKNAILARKCTPIRRADKRSTVAVYSSKAVKRVKRLL
ncbi:MAG: PHP-associated domain-containing protein [Chloroflexota bacterium]